jgi:hypothetical protein
MIYVLLAVDGFVFLSLLAIASIIFIALSAIDDPNPTASSIVLAISIAFLILFTNAGQSVLEHPWQTILYIVGYFVVGCTYSMFLRWPLYLRGLRKRLSQEKERLLKSHDMAVNTVITPDFKDFEAWQSVVTDVGCGNGMRLLDNGKLQPPQYYDNKARLTTWGVVWPWNLLWVIVRRPIIWVFEELLSLEILKRICQAMSNWTFKDFNQ